MTPIYWLLGIDAAGSIARVSDWAWRANAALPLWAIVLIAAIGLVMAALNFLPHSVATWTTRLLLAVVRIAGQLSACTIRARFYSIS